MLKFLNGKVSDRKLRLLGCACCRRVWAILPDHPSRLIVDAVERFVEGLEPSTVIGNLRRQSCRADTGYLHCSNLAVCKASLNSTDAILGGAARLFAFEKAWGIREEKRQAECVAQLALLRDVFGNPFRPVAANPRWLSWNDGTVPRLAWDTYDNRHLPTGLLDAGKLAILADALEEAGCDNADIVGHLRAGGEHVRGCWVIDLLLGKQ